jgi:hypothetical protein
MVATYALYGIDARPASTKSEQRVSDMATPRQIHALHNRRPFRPFRLRLSSGAAFDVTHPENIAYGMNSREVALFDRDEFHLLDIDLIEVVELAPVTGTQTDQDRPE